MNRQTNVQKTAMIHSVSMILVFAVICCQGRAFAEPQVGTYLGSGKLADGEKALNAMLKKNPDDDEARFSLGIVQFLQAVEQLGQSQHKYGLMHHRAGRIPFIRLPIPKNDDPEELSYQQCRAIFSQFSKDLELAEATLAKVDTTDVKLPIHFGRIRLDLDGDGEATDEETFWRIFAVFNPGVNEAAGTTFRIGFDGGDVHWLRGYCHLLMTFCDVALAHDWQELFERCGHWAYPRVKTPHTFLADEGNVDIRGFEFRWIADVIATIHLINFPVEDPELMKSAHKHLQAMVAQSRASWTRILSETDNDDEWLPNPKQTAVIPNVRVRQEMIDGWHEFLDESEALLRGEKLIPFWRGYREKRDEVFTQKRGVNLKRVFTEPRQFDLVMWVTGTGATPYLEEGELTDFRTWDRLMRVFGGEFFGFAIWFN